MIWGLLLRFAPWVARLRLPLLAVGLVSALGAAYAAGWHRASISARAHEAAVLQAKLAEAQASYDQGMRVISRWYQEQLRIQKGRVKIREVVREVPAPNADCRLPPVVDRMLEAHRQGLFGVQSPTPGSAKAPAGAAPGAQLSRRQLVRAYGDLLGHYAECRSQIEGLRSYYGVGRMGSK